VDCREKRVENGEHKEEKRRKREKKSGKMRRKEKIKLKYAGTYAGIGNSFLIF
jgi:hypothetical protein